MITQVNQLLNVQMLYYSMSYGWIMDDAYSDMY